MAMLWGEMPSRASGLPLCLRCSEEREQTATQTFSLTVAIASHHQASQNQEEIHQETTQGEDSDAGCACHQGSIVGVITIGCALQG